jgi:tetratricopeptide (TPR) repeat protein
MVRKHVRAAGAALLLTFVSSCAAPGELTIRELSTGLASGNQPLQFRLAEARSHFRLGNIALASEGFRRALREDASSVDALNGLAACYDRMSRFDLARSHYERALALAPDDARIYANLATSLELQGRSGEASKVRAELSDRLAAGARANVKLAEAEPIGPLVAAPVIPDATPTSMVTLVLSDPIPAPTAHAASAPQPAAVAGGPRLERTGLAEVTLVTDRKSRTLFASARPAPVQQPAVAARSSNQPPITILNAARVNRLAASTRERLGRLGWTAIAIGNAPQVTDVSQVSYGDERRAEAQRLAARLGIVARRSPSASSGRLVVILGRDVARRHSGA